ncbi:MAG: VOC family protein [Bacteroidales bacterium]|nr:VOC family protein [Bacteroidales bacterium]MCF8404495.1 VOC family protein [Bacteroidales bacterium]
MDKKGKVTGLGGIFIKSSDPKSLKNWYEEHLGLPCDEYGHMFAWRDKEDVAKIGYTQFSVFEKNTDYLKPAKKEFMLNFRVDDLEEMIKRLISEGMEVVGDIQSYDYGKFGWVMDPDGNKIELWEPVDETFTELDKQEKQ